MKNLHILKITAFSFSVAFSCLLACSHTQDASLISVSGADSLMIGKRLSPKLAAKKAAQLDSFMNYMHRSQGFNGTVLVSQYGQVVYKGAFGYGNFANHDTLTPSSSFNLASVSKQFTSVAIMQLKEKGLLNYDDPVVKYIPNFPYDGSITIRSLLTHSSGIPNYVYALDRYYNKKAPISNQLVADLFAAFRPRPNYLPNSHFNYNNSNYCLLACIVERLSGMSFRDYAKQHFFEPLHMEHSFIYDPTKPEEYDKASMGYTAGRRRVYPDHLDGVVGDKGVYSTVEDLYKWDVALDTEKLLKNSTLEEAFRPALSFPNLITKNYGYGWRLQLLPNGEWFTYHTGWWHGFKAYYLHNRKDFSSIILLSNIANGTLRADNIKQLQAILYPDKAGMILGEAESMEEEGQE